jgi:hypothetical protein
MIIKTLKNVQEDILKSYKLEYHFIDPKTQNLYKLPLIVRVADKLEAMAFQGAILGALSKEGMEIRTMKSMKLIYSTRLERAKEEIANSQLINGFETIRINFEKPDNDKSKKIVSYQIKVNTLKKHKPIPENSGDLFTLEIPKKEF